MSSPALDVICQAQQSDLNQEEARILQEREDRRLLRIQATNNQGLSISELVQRMTGKSDDSTNAPAMNVISEEPANDRPKIESAFPAPPTTGSTGA